MTFAEKIYQGHAAVKHGWSLVWNNKILLFYTAVLLVIVIPVASYFSYLITQSLIQVPRCIDAAWWLILGGMAGMQFISYIIYACFFNFLLLRIQGRPASFMQSLIFDRNRTKLIFIISLLFSFSSLFPLFLLFFPATGFSFIASLLNYIFDIILYFGLLLVVDHVPGFWLALTGAAHFLWTNLLATIVMYFEIIIWFMLTFGSIVVAGILLMRTLFVDFFKTVFSLYSSQEGVVKFLSLVTVNPVALLFSVLWCLLFFAVILFMIPVFMAAMVSLYKNAK